jgi:hypothetical protein
MSSKALKPFIEGTLLRNQRLDAMNQESIDIEAYVQTDDAGAVASLLSVSLGALDAEHLPEADLSIYRNEDATVLIQPSEEGFLSVSLRGLAPWKTCPALARHLAHGLRCTVRCDPGEEYPEISPYSNTFLQIKDNKENFVPWG